MKKHIFSLLITISMALGTSQTYAAEYLPGQTYTDKRFLSWSICPTPAGAAELEIFSDIPGGAVLTPLSFTIPATPGYFYPVTVTFTTPTTPGTYFYEIDDLINGTVLLIQDVVVTATPAPASISTFTVPVGQAKDTITTFTNTPFSLGNGCSIVSQSFTYNITTYPSSPKLTLINPLFTVAPNATASLGYHLFSATPGIFSFLRQVNIDGGSPSYRRIDVTFTCVAPNATITAAGPTTICSGQSVTLNAVVAANRTYQWDKNGTSIPGATSSSFSAADAGTYKVTVTNTVSGCTKTTATGIAVTVNQLPNATITAGGPTTFCDGLNVTLNAVVAANRTYQWKRGTNNISGATASSYLASVGGNYKVIVTNTVTGCSKTTGATTVVSVNPLPVALITPSGTISFCAGQSAKLKATNSFGYTFQWKKNNVNITNAIGDSLMVTTAGKYKVLVTNAFFCTKTSKNDTVIVPCRDDMPGDLSSLMNETASDLMIYPNPANDLLTIDVNCNSPQTTITVYNLLGKQVMSKIIHANENGKCHEELDITNLPAGLYVINVITETGFQQVKKFIKE